MTLIQRAIERLREADALLDGESVDQLILMRRLLDSGSYAVQSDDTIPPEVIHDLMVARLDRAIARKRKEN